jgi:pimeloyl-ACP methyl ester carboxylesterase
MRKVFWCLSAAAVAAVLVIMRLRERAHRGCDPAHVHFRPEGFEPELFEAPTGDGIVLRGKRYPRPGATPVILMHGFVGSCYDFDLAFEECNMALFLARRGYDVWIANFRGVGREPHKSDAGDFSHSIEDLVFYDMPALVDAVTERTGKRPVWIGHSMGAVVAYGYLQGVTRTEEDGALRVRPDPDLAGEHNRKLAALVSIAGPTCFRWPRDSMFHWMVGTPISRPVLKAAGALLLRLNRVVPQLPVERLSVGILTYAPKVGQALMARAVGFFINLDNMSEETLRETLLSGSGDVSMTETVQMVEAMLNQEFTEKAAATSDMKSEPYSYTGGMNLVTAPVLFVTGDRDPVNHRTVYQTGYLEVSSPTRDFRCFPDYSHIDLVCGIDTCKTVYPYIAEWLDEVVGAGYAKDDEASDRGD